MKKRKSSLKTGKRMMEVILLLETSKMKKLPPLKLLEKFLRQKIHPLQNYEILLDMDLLPQM